MHTSGDKPAAGARGVGGEPRGGSSATPGTTDGGGGGGEMSVGQLARLSGVSVRALHYYEEQGLLHPGRTAGGYRSYSRADVLRLQQILLFRGVDMPVGRIRQILDAPAPQRAAAMREQLGRLEQRRRKLDGLIEAVRGMIADETGGQGAPDEKEDGTDMGKKAHGKGASAGRDSDERRFEALKQQAIQENERTYGQEARDRWGDDAVDGSNARVAGMTQQQWDRAQELSAQIMQDIAQIASQDDPQAEARGETGRRLCLEHREWLQMYWSPGTYSPQAHRGLAQMYVDDPRFAAFYEKAAPDGARVIRDAIDAWCERI